MNATAAATPSTQFARITLVDIQAMDGLSGSNCRVYLALALHANEQRQCWPGRTRLANIVNLSPDNTSRALRELEQKGLIQRQRNGRKPRYMLQSQKVADLIAKPPSELSDLIAKPPSELSDLIAIEQTIFNRPEREEQGAHAKSAVAMPEPASTLSVKEKNPMTKLTDELMERAKKTVRQRGIREDLSDTAISHSIAKCQAQKGYLEMTENDWIETVVQWVGKERASTASTARSEPFSSQPRVEVSPEEKARRDAEYEARMSLIDSGRERNRLLLLEQRGIDPKTGTKASSDPVDAIKALAAKVNVKPSAAPPARTFGPMGFIPGQRPPDAPKVQPLPEAPRAALNKLLMDVHRAGLPIPNIAGIQQEIRDAGENWPAVIDQYRQGLNQHQEVAA